jgi:GAF domain-containing protein
LECSEDEIVRLKRLHDLKILDTPPEEGFDRLVELASLVFDCPISLVSLVDEDRQWFKAEVGLGTHETGRDVSFCAHSFAKVDEVFLVPDANQDPRFAKNPLVTSKPDIGFYAGAPLVTTDGYPIGTLCVIDHKARDDISPKQLKVLQALAKQARSVQQRR